MRAKKKRNRTLFFTKREREHLIDVKENNLRSKESLKRDDRQRRQGSESFTFFSSFIVTNQQIEYREREKQNIVYI